MVEPNFDAIDPNLLDEIDHQMMKVVNFPARIKALVAEGYSDLWVNDPRTGRSKLICILSLPN